jgi:hypothetical protein
MIDRVMGEWLAVPCGQQIQLGWRLLGLRYDPFFVRRKGDLCSLA